MGSEGGGVEMASTNAVEIVLHMFDACFAAGWSARLQKRRSSGFTQSLRCIGKGWMRTGLLGRKVVSVGGSSVQDTCS